jgi:phosphate uptake regulator
MNTQNTDAEAEREDRDEAIDEAVSSCLEAVGTLARLHSEPASSLVSRLALFIIEEVERVEDFMADLANYVEELRAGEEARKPKRESFIP